VDATGALTIDGVGPEKSLAMLQSAALQRTLAVNTIGPALLLRALAPLLAKGDAVYAKLSARVGSISDNRKGGWYGYRAAKAAGRRAPNVSLLAYHPGAVDTPLSAPFHRSVPAGVLQQPQETAAALLALMDAPGEPGSARFVDYAGETLPW